MVKPRVKQSEEEQVLALQQRADAIRLRGALKDVNAALKQYPEFAPNVMECLHRLGVPKKKLSMLSVEETPGGAGDATSPPSSRRATSASTPTAGVAEAGSRGGERGQDTEVSNQGGVIPRCYTKVGMIPPKYIIELLATVEQVSLSEAALRGLVRRGSRHIIKEDLLKVLELVGNVGPEDDLPAKFHEAPVFAEHLRHFNDSRGRPARELRLPPVWEECGVFSLECKSKTAVYLTHNLMKKTARLPESFLKKVGDYKGLVLEQNWSEKQAAVKELGAFAKLTCLLVFADSAVEDTVFSISLPTTALEDREAGSEGDEEADSAAAAPRVAAVPSPSAPGRVPAATSPAVRVALRGKTRVSSDADMAVPSPPKKGKK